MSKVIYLLSTESDEANIKGYGPEFSNADSIAANPDTAKTGEVRQSHHRRNGRWLGRRRRANIALPSLSEGAI